MVEDRIADGRRIAQLLSSELEGRQDGQLERIAVSNAAPDIEPSADGARAYDVTRDDERVARVFVHDDRAHVAFAVGREAAVEAAGDAGLRVRPKATSPPKALVFVESGAEVKPATDVVQAASRAVDER